jgi:hypothetical protein
MSSPNALLIVSNSLIHFSMKSSNGRSLLLASAFLLLLASRLFLICLVLMVGAQLNFPVRLWPRRACHVSITTEHTSLEPFGPVLPVVVVRNGLRIVAIVVNQEATQRRLLSQVLECIAKSPC